MGSKLIALLITIIFIVTSIVLFATDADKKTLYSVFGITVAMVVISVYLWRNDWLN